MATSIVLGPPIDPTLLPTFEKFNEIALASFEVVRSVAPETLQSVLAKTKTELVHTEYTVPALDDGSNTNSVILSVFHSKHSTSKSRPAVYGVHGGGQIAGSRFSGVDFYSKWCDGIDAVLVSVEYRLAPEHPAPAALNDCYTGLVWTAEHTAELGIDPSKIMILGGSGGAPIAAGCALLARNNNYPKLCAQMLLTPMLDDRNTTISAKQYYDNGGWSAKVNAMAWDCVLGSKRGGPDVSELVAPARATDLSGLPPTFIDAGEAEVFRDEAVAYASLLWKCGVSAELHVWPGAFHGFDLMVPDAPLSRRALATKQNWIKRAFEVSE